MAKQPSVLFLNRVYPPVRGATGRVLRDLARAFVRDGWDVTVVTTGTAEREEKDGPIRIVRVAAALKNKSVFGYAGVWFKLLRAGMKLPAHDLVITMTDPPMLITAGQMIAKSKKSRHMHWCQDLYPDLLPTLGINLPDFMLGLLRKQSRRDMGACDKVVTIGRCMARNLTHSGVDAKKISVIPNWPDFELIPGRGPRFSVKSRFRRANGDAANAKEAAAAAVARPHEQLFRDGDNPKFRVLYSGNLGRAHPIGTVLDAAEILGREAPDVELVFVGDGTGQDRLMAERARRRLENIRFLPWQPASRLRELMESGDVHLISMTHDAAGMLVPSKLYSALAVARPCIFIGPAQSEAARVINDFKAGRVVSQGDAEGLANTIMDFRNSGEMWMAAHQGAGQAGRIFIPDESLNAWLKRARDVVGLPSAPEAREEKAA
ncbi:MAG: glycosyl transferase group 1 family protein [Micavibrio sp.]|nr:glycosyl transferase group 1 family protein [Micavibrio sp.]